MLSKTVKLLIENFTNNLRFYENVILFIFLV